MATGATIFNNQSQSVSAVNYDISQYKLTNYNQTYVKNSNLDVHQWITETIFEKTLFKLDIFSLVNVPSTNIEGAGFMTCTEPNHQGAIKVIWLNFWATVMSSIFLYSQWLIHTEHRYTEYSSIN